MRYDSFRHLSANLLRRPASICRAQTGSRIVPLRFGTASCLYKSAAYLMDSIKVTNIVWASRSLARPYQLRLGRRSL